MKAVSRSGSACARGEGVKSMRVLLGALVPSQQLAGDDQALDLARALADLAHPGVAEGAPDGELARVPAPAEDLHGRAAGAQRGLGGEKLGHRGLLLEG